MSASSTPLPTLLGKFSVLPRADIILRSSDSQDVLVQKLYVVDSSPVLGEQIIASTNSLGREAPCEATTVDGETRGGPLLPVVQLAESHATLSSLLTFVFPVLPVLPPTIEQILELISVAEKYDMTTALVRIRDCASRRDPPFICPETALQVYSLARKYGLLKETFEAAEETLKSPMTIQDLEDKLGIVPSVALYELWQYRQRVLVDLNGSLKSSESEVYQIFSGEYLACVEIDEDSELPMWLNQYLDSVLEDPACVDLTTFHLALSSHVSVGGDDCCECCSYISRGTIREFWIALTTAVRESTRKAESDLSFIEGEIHVPGTTSATSKASPLAEGLIMQGADVILRSSDLVSFRVHKSILAISSPFFGDMFSLPQPLDGIIIDGLPVVDVSEDAELLHSLLTALYPIPSSIPVSHEKHFALLAALQKYEMTTVLSTVRSEIGRQLPATESPFRMYAIASRKQLIPEMKTAARLTLDHPMTFKTIGDALPFFDHSSLQDLVQFRKRCHNKLLSFFEGFVNGSDNLSKIWFGCKTPRKRPQSTVILAGWLRDFVFQHTKSLKETYTNPFPTPSSLRKEFTANLLHHVSQDLCSSCSTGYAKEGEAFLDQLYCRVSKIRRGTY